MLDHDHTTGEALAALSMTEHDASMIDRRRFLQLVGMGVGAGLTSGGVFSLLDAHLPGFGDAQAWAAGPLGANDGIVVMIGMLGGNDGLNTVVPINDGNYYQQHGALAVPAASTLPIAGDTGLHPALTEVKRLWDVGQVAIVEGVGYPGQDLSHFSSIANWMGGSVGGVPTTGWVGRWLDGLLGAQQDIFAAAVVGNTVPLHLVGASHRGTAVPPRRPLFGAGTDPMEVRMHEAVRSMRSSANGAMHTSISTALSDQIDLTQRVAPIIPEGLDETSIVTQLEVAARLINANLGFRVLTTSWGDFDSHAGQPSMHTKRMTDLNAALTKFFQTLDPAWGSRVTVMTYSEFGRTSWANDGQGTDHGSAAPHFVIGRNVRGGIYGLRPTLQGIGRWDRMAHHVDFRSYYTSVLDGWLGGGAASVLGGTFENLGLFAGGPGTNPASPNNPVPAVVTPPGAFVPVSPFRLVDSREGTGGVSRRPLGPGERVRVKILGVGPIPASGPVAVVANVTSVNASTPGYLTVYPGSTIRPETSNLNSGPGRPVPNLVVMGIGADGYVEVFNAFGTSDCLVDVFGYFDANAGDRFTPLAPARLFDTRTGAGIRPGKVATGDPVAIQVAGQVGVPASGATAVVVNLTVAEPDSPGWMRLTPADQSGATTSNVNFSGGDSVCNLVMCKLSPDGRLIVEGFGDGSHVIGDVFGYFGPSGSRVRALPPERVLDTRIGVGAPVAPAGPGANVQLQLAGRAQIPSAATAVVINVTAANVLAPTYLTVWPSGTAQPDSSNLNVVANQVVANLVVCRLGADGALSIASPIANCDVIADVLGYFVD